MPIQNPFTSSSVEQQSTRSGCGHFQVISDDAQHARSNLAQVTLAFQQSTRSAAPVETVPGETAGPPQPRRAQRDADFPPAWDRQVFRALLGNLLVAQNFCGLTKAWLE
jgi:hypothetical protein